MTFMISYQMIACEQGAAVPIRKYIYPDMYELNQTATLFPECK